MFICACAKYSFVPSEHLPSLENIGQNQGVQMTDMRSLERQSLETLEYSVAAVPALT